MQGAVANAPAGSVFAQDRCHEIVVVGRVHEVVQCCGVDPGVSRQAPRHGWEIRRQGWEVMWQRRRRKNLSVAAILSPPLHHNQHDWVTCWQVLCPLILPSRGDGQIV